MIFLLQGKSKLKDVTPSQSLAGSLVTLGNAGTHRGLAGDVYSQPAWGQGAFVKNKCKVGV